jgi:hypothetical protein
VLTIKDYTLIIDDKTIPLPRLERLARVKVWRVPIEYRPDGLFVSVTSFNEPEEIPACNLSECEFLGEDVLIPLRNIMNIQSHDSVKRDTYKRAARIENGKVVDLWAVPSLDCYGDRYTLVEAPEWVQIGATWDGTTFTNPPPPEKTFDEIVAEFTKKVQFRLDAFARTRGYDNIFSACTYATSTDPKFSVEGQYCIQVRDVTWSKCYEILDDIQSGQRSVPTWEEFEAELPVLQWPN